MPTIYCSYLRCGDRRSPGATERRNGSLGLRDDDDGDGRLVSHTVQRKWTGLAEFNFDLIVHVPDRILVPNR